MDVVETNSFKLLSHVEEASTSDEIKSLILKYINEKEGDCSAYSIPDSSKLYSGLRYVNYDSNVEPSHTSGKLVLLDFFTYCCINCIHIMPSLHQLEAQIPDTDGLLIIGVHSAKFGNEKVEENILKAIERYEICHPVINDSELDVWTEFSVKCWPTLILLSPSRKVLFSLAGESHMNFVKIFIEYATSYYNSSGALSKKELSLAPLESFEEIDGPTTSMNLKFPGKLSVDDSGERIAISDSGHNRIVVSDMQGNVSLIIGGTAPGFVDGDFRLARFSSPQGICWHGRNTIFVADCNNHAVRKVDLLVNKVVTVVGTGVQGNDLEGGQNGLEQPISSPWDVVVGGSPCLPGGKSLLYIAMSGCHQIWTLALKTTDFQRGAEIEMGTCIRYAGSGKEENRNNAYPHKAGFAQPSGLTHSMIDHAVYIADSESSTVRKMLLSNGTVQGLVGGDIDPTDLFAYGDSDGVGRKAKLQHPVGVQWDSVRNVLYVADTYNHKIKILHPKKKICITMDGMEDDNGKSNLSEPSGLAIDPSCTHLYIADTNNHEIKVVSLNDYTIDKLSLKLDIDIDSLTLQRNRVELLTGEKGPAKVLSSHKCSQSQKLLVSLSYGDFNLNWDAPSSWQVSIQREDKQQLYLISSGSFDKDSNASISFVLSDIIRESNSKKFEWIIGQVANLYVESILYYCVDDDMCKMLRYKALVPLEIVPEGEIVANESTIQIDISS